LLSNNFVNSAQVGSEHLRASIEKLQNNHKYQGSPCEIAFIKDRTKK